MRESIEFHQRNAIVCADDVHFTFEVTDNPRQFDEQRERKNDLDWAQSVNHIGDWNIHPYGNNNDLPSVIQKAVYENNAAPGLLAKKTQLDWGRGPMLYTEEIEDNAPVKKWLFDKDVQAWLDDWDYKDYLLRNLTDFNHIEGSFTKYKLARGARVGRKFIAELEHLMPHECRTASAQSSIVKHRPKPTHAVVTDFGLNSISALDYEVYPLFNFKNPFAAKTSIFYSSLYTFCSEYYAIPKLYGSLEWLRRSTAIPLILKALSKNSMNIKYHIQSPAEYWDRKREILERKCQQEGKTYKESMLEDYKRDFLRRISKTLASDENTGKFFHTEKVLNAEGTSLIEQGWEINVLDQKVKDFINAQLGISKHANYALSANISIHSALANVSEAGKSDSGSEQLYALQNYLLTGVDIPEMVVMKPINYALRANFPNKGLKMGFYHEAGKREEDKTPNDRHKNLAAK